MKIIALAFALIALASFAEPALGQCASFQAEPRVRVGAAPVSIAVGDFNDDGAVDFVVVNRSAGKVTIGLGDGVGGFSSQKTIALGSFPPSAVVGDFNDDAESDIAVVTGDGVTILLGDGAGNFTKRPNIPVSGGGLSIAVDDFSGDAELDLAVGNGSNVVILLGDGTGAFSSAGSLAAGDVVRSIATGKFDSDNAVDLAVLNGAGFASKVSVFLGNGDGTFSAPTNFAVGADAFSVVVGDFDEDNVLDLAVANAFDDSVSILLGDGFGGFGPQTVVGVGNCELGCAPIALVTEDFDNDGNLDLATANQFDNSVSVLLGDGLGGFRLLSKFGLPSQFDVSQNAGAIATEDFNGDAYLDLLVADGAAVSVLTNSCAVLADLQLSGGPSKFAAQPNEQITYGFFISNAGPSNATAVVLTDVLPAGFSLVSTNPSQGACSFSNNTVTCDFGTLAPGDSAQVEFGILLTATGQFCNAASVASDQVDPNPADNTTTNINPSLACVSVAAHDLAIVSLRAPKTVALSGVLTSVTKRVKIQIQNRSPRTETISSLDGLVDLELNSLGTNNCPPPQPVVVQGRPQHKLPVTLLPRQKLTVLFNVAFTTDCVPDPAKTTALNPDHEDYSYAATLHYSVIDPSEPVDSHSADDVCPRDPQGIDPYPNGKILDKGCGSRKPDPPHTLGGPVLTDVIVSP